MGVQCSGGDSIKALELLPCVQFNRFIMFKVQPSSNCRLITQSSHELFFSASRHPGEKIVRKRNSGDILQRGQNCRETSCQERGAPRFETWQCEYQHSHNQLIEYPFLFAS